MSSFTDKPSFFPSSPPSLTRSFTACNNAVPILTSKSDIAEWPETAKIHYKCPEFMLLRIFVDGPNDLYNQYVAKVAEHNEKILNETYIDAGFDLFTPGTQTCDPFTVNKIDFKIKCSAHMVTKHGQDPCKIYPTGYFMYARSSIYKTRLRLANCVGIIDAGYRGNIMGMFDCLQSRDPDEVQTVDKYDRLTQICAPGSVPIYVEMVDNMDDLGVTSRGAGGFGSTGR